MADNLIFNEWYCVKEHSGMVIVAVTGPVGGI